MTAWEEAVRAVEHHERCNVWAGKSLTMLPVIELASGRIPFEPSCTCDRDARIAKGIEAVRDADRLHVCKYMGDGVFDCECGFRLTSTNGPFFAHVDAAALAAFTKATQ